jgi:hypothetical protein
MPDPHFANTPAYFKEISSGDTPSSGQISLYAKTDGKMYYKDDAGVETEIGGGGGVTTSSTAPVSPSAGDLWFNSDNASLYIYYDDGDSQQWVSASWQTPNLGGGKVAQVVVASTTIPSTTTASIPVDDTIPQSTEGTEFMTVSITPTNTSSTLIIEFDAWVARSDTGVLIMALFRDSTANALQTTIQTISGPKFASPGRVKALVSAGSTRSTTFKLRYGVNIGTGSILRTPAAAALFGASDIAYMTVTEILP